MTFFKTALKNVRKYGGDILKYIGLGTVVTSASTIDDKAKDWLTIGVIGFVVILLLGRR